MATLRICPMMLLVFVTQLITPSLKGADKLLVLAPEADAFQEILLTIKSEIDGDFELKYIKVDRSSLLNATTYREVEAYLENEKPKAIILMDNPAVDLYRHYQRSNPRDIYPRSIVCMALFVEEIIKDLKNVIGIPHQVPIVKSLTQLRGKLEVSDSIDRIGVIYRDRYASFYQRQARNCARENIKLVGYAIPEKNMKGKKRASYYRNQLKEGLDSLIKREKVDAIWVINDNELVNATMIEEVWSKKLKGKRLWVIVGVNGFIQQGFGNFAVLPDRNEIGLQVVDLLYDFDHGNEENINQVEEPRSSITHLKVKYAKKYLGFIDEKKGEIDFLIYD